MAPSVAAPERPAQVPGRPKQQGPVARPAELLGVLAVEAEALPLAVARALPARTQTEPLGAQEAQELQGQAVERPVCPEAVLEELGAPQVDATLAAAPTKTPRQPVEHP